MNKRLNQKVVSFPGAAGQLVKQGLEQLKSGEKEEAVHVFRQALIHESGNPDASYGLLLAYAEAGHLQEAAGWAEELLKDNTGDFLEILHVYVPVLAQLGRYDQVVETLDEVQKTKEVPAHLKEQFQELYTLADGMMQMDVETEEYDTTLEERSSLPVEWEMVLQMGTEEQKLHVLNVLRKEGPEKWMPAIRELLARPETSPLMKSFLLLLLKDWQIEDTVWVQKLGRKGDFAPSTLPAMEDSSSYKESSSLLDRSLGDKDPVLLQHAKELLQQLLLYYYPFPPSVQIEVLAAVLHFETLRQFEPLPDEQGIRDFYGVAEPGFKSMQQEYERIQGFIQEI
jgi:tetratricopeptide (TPR) repeat protein